MSLEEVREAGATATLTPPTDSSSSEDQPKVVRRRRTTKADATEADAPEGTTPASADVTASDADAAKPVRRRITRKKDETAEVPTSTSDEASPALPGLTLPLETAPTPAKPTRGRPKAVTAPAAQETPADVPAPATPNPPAVEIPTPAQMGMNPVVRRPRPSAPVSSAIEAPVDFIADTESGSYASTSATPSDFGSDRIDSDRGQRMGSAATPGFPIAPTPAPENLLPVDPNVQTDREEGGYNQEGGFRGEEGGFRPSGRMSYRDRRALRREQRMQNRPPRFGENGAPIDGMQAPVERIERPLERPDRPERPDRIVERPLERPLDRPMNGGQNQGRPNTNFQPTRRREVDMLVLDEMEMPALLGVAAEFNLAEPPLEKADLIYAILEAQAFAQNALLKKGVLEIASDGKGFMRCDGYTPADGDVYVSQTQIKRFNLKTGDMVLGAVRAPKETERFHGLLRVEAINGIATELMKSRKDFEKLTPIFPEERYVLETDQTNITARIIDLVSPIGKGQRGLIVAPPKAGKTTLLKSIANSITRNNPEVDLFVLLIDERPEEVTDISRSVRGEVVASTFDEMPENHMRVADIVMERAKRLVEMQRDVVILLDSITRLSRASNLVVTPSGRTLSGGLDPAAMYRPKRMFGAARNIEQGGSLTILATALVDTGSRMDEMIFEEFKGTGNMDLVLDRALFDQRIFPAIDINRTGTRRDDLLMNKEELAATYHLRRTLAALDNDKAVTLLIDRLKNTKSNSHFMEVVAKSARQSNNGG